jgi:uncharacterized DUF497 family protein
MKVAGFEWDAGNREKCQKHGVSLVEIEALFSRPIMMLPDHAHSMTEVRLKAIGRTESGRNIFIVFTLREHHGRKYIRPISARYMHQKEVDSYETANPDV